MRREDSPQGQEEQEGGHEGCHRHTVAHIVDHKGDVVVQVVLLLLDRQTDTWADGGMGHRQGGAGALAVAPLCVLTLGAEVAPGVVSTPGPYGRLSVWRSSSPTEDCVG